MQSVEDAVSSHISTMLFAWNVTFAAVVAGISPLALVALLVSVAAIVLAGSRSTDFLQTWKASSDGLGEGIVLFIFYVGVSAFWSVSAADILSATASLFVLGVLLFLPRFIRGMNDLQMHRTARGILLGFLIASGYCLYEHLTGFALLRTAAIYFPELFRSSVSLAGLNRHVTLLVFFVWSAVLVLNVWTPKPVRQIALVLIFAALLVILFRTESATAQLAFILALLAFAGAYFRPVFMFNIVRFFWVLVLVLIVPMTLVLGKSGLHQDNSVGLSARHRIVIWNYTAKNVLKNPLLGAGIRAGRYSTDHPEKVLVRTIYSPIRYSPKGWHPHNMYLQIWYELGAIGAAFVLSIGLLLLNRIRRLPARLQPYALATFSAFAAIAGVGWGMWQSWLLAAYGWAMIFLVIAFEYAGRRETAGAETT